MRFKLIILLSFILFANLSAQIPPQNSLLKSLPASTDREKVDIYRNLADIYYRLPEEEKYLRLTYHYAKKLNLIESQLETLSDIVVLKIEANQIDSANYYIEKVADLAPKKDVNKWTSYLSMYLFNYLIYEDPKNGEVAVSEAMNSIKSGTKNDIYTRIKHAYIVASSIFIQKKYDQVWPYVNTMAELAESLPFKDGCRYHLLALRMQARLLPRKAKHTEAIKLVEDIISTKERYVDIFYKNSRPYYPMDEFYIASYTTLMLNASVLSKEKSEFYISRLLKLNEKSAVPRDKYNCFLSLSNYYLTRKEWNQALQTNDSLIKYAHIIAPYNIASLNNMSSYIYEQLNRPADALASLKTAHRVKDSINTIEAKETLNKLQVEYDLNKLNYENSQLEIKNKMMMITGLLILLSMFVVLCAYLYKNLKSEQYMKAHLHSLMLRAEQSEKMKSEFMNSICHEIRTPLNAISGFTSLLFDPSVDEESKQCFPVEIQQNTKILTSLVDCMLEVSLLDVSDEKLPCEPTNISAMCHEILERTRSQVKDGVCCSVVLGCDPMIISTNAHYLSLSLENLANNACKFTQKGSIVIGCDIKDKMLVMSVTDTGCGIPEDMHDVVFDRFTKLDSYKQGSGLGLYLCKLVVTRLLGKIYIDSSYKEGTRMVVELPIEDK